ncbi:hypothetical protein CL614_02910 [archaeon]|nr:hypothetical protein [archaeon]
MNNSSKFVFQNYAEYFKLTRPLSLFQRKKIFGDLSPSERDFLEGDFDKNRWEDLLIKNEVNRRADSIKKKYNKDLFLMKIKILSGKKIRVKKSFWRHVVSSFSDIPGEYLYQLLGGVASYEDEEDASTCILKLDRKGYNSE